MATPPLSASAVLRGAADVDEGGAGSVLWAEAVGAQDRLPVTVAATATAAGRVRAERIRKKGFSKGNAAERVWVGDVGRWFSGSGLAPAVRVLRAARGSSGRVR